MDDAFLSRFVEWLSMSSTWWGPRGLVALTRQHVWISFVATVMAAALALPPALWLGHRRSGRFAATAVANIGRAVPSFGIIVVLAVVFIRNGLGAGFWPLTLALVALAVPPMFTNAHASIAGIDPAVVEAARGTGHRELEVLRMVELPLALPLLLDGVRLALVQVIATTALGAVVSGRGGLGGPIVTGFATFRSGGDVILVGGALAVALLTVVADRLFSVTERMVVPAGVRRLTRPEPELTGR